MSESQYPLRNVNSAPVSATANNGLLGLNDGELVIFPDVAGPAQAAAEAAQAAADQAAAAVVEASSARDDAVAAVAQIDMGALTEAVTQTAASADLAHAWAEGTPPGSPINKSAMAWASAAQAVVEQFSGAPISWADFARFASLPNGAILPFAGIMFERDRESDIADFPAGPGWKPFGYSTANHFGAVRGRTISAADAFRAAAAYEDSRGGGLITALPGEYLMPAGFELPCGVDFVDSFGRIVLVCTAILGDMLYGSTNPARLGQHSRIHGITFGRLGTTGGRAIYTEDDNAPFFTQSPHWDIQRCTTLDLSADYTLPPSPFTGGPQFGWMCAVDLHHSNGNVVMHNDFFGHYSPYRAYAGQDECIGVRMGTNGSSGVIASKISHNRIWYWHTPLQIEEDVLAFWFTENECIKCYRGPHAPADPLGDGVVSQADTRICDNYITVQAVAINLENRQMLHIIGNHCNSDAGYVDPGGAGFNGIRLANCTKYKIRGNSANLAAGHAAWAGVHRAVVLTGSSGGTVVDQAASRYFHEGIYFNSAEDVLVTGSQFTQLTDAAYAFNGTCRTIDIGKTSFPGGEPAQRLKFYDANTSIHNFGSIMDEWVLPLAVTSVAPSAGAIKVTRRSHLVTISAATTITSITGPNVRDGVRLTLRPSSSAFALTLTQGGNLQLAGDWVSTNARDTIELEYSNALSAWLEIGRSINGT